MCGMCGYLGFGASYPIDARTLAHMRDTMAHRGPDGANSWISQDGRVGLGHRRLAIIDLSEAAIQPMQDRSGRVIVTSNHEVYNHVGLRKQLESEGRVFRTDHSDTEVLVEGFARWGIDGLLERIEGDYAFGLWSENEDALYLVRDRVGVKPLYFWHGPQGLIFASEIKAILAHPFVSAEIEPIAMYHYLTSLITPAPLTMFKGIFKLPAGYYLRVSKSGEVKAVRYWDSLPGRGIPRGTLDRMSERDRFEFCKQGVLQRLDAAVEKRMMSDVPFGVFLSGGIDSSTNVALMSRYTSEPLRTFTVGFKDHKELNEIEYARIVAQRFNTDHREILIDEADMAGYLDQLVFSQDEPIADWVCIPLYFVSKLAHDSGVTVVQVGEGSDEQFCGYDSYMAYLKLHERYWSPYRRFVPSGVQEMLAACARSVTRGNIELQVYADIFDRAARGREHFWSGAMVFWNLMKDELIDSRRVQASSAARKAVQWGLMPEHYLEPDTYRVFEAIYGTIDSQVPGSDVLTRMIYSEFKHRLPELLLMRVDKIGMSVSLEPRVPFLDDKLIDFTMDIPMDLKVKGKTAKHLLKEAVRGVIPDDIITRKKMGFSAPMAHWMRGEFGGEMERVLLRSRLLREMPFNVDYVRNLIAQHRSGRRNAAIHLWSLFNLVAWHERWIDGVGVRSAA